MTLSNKIVPKRNERKEAWSVQLPLGLSLSPVPASFRSWTPAGAPRPEASLDLHFDAMMSRED